ncbi:MAG: TlpA disulfide reductase family protein [Bacteroidota bacterium]
MKKSILTLVLGLLITTLSFGQEAKSLFNKEIPDMTVKLLNGMNKNLKEFAENGKITVFTFWATWCVPCKKELDNMVELYEGWQEDYNVEIVAVSTDDARSLAKVKATVNTNDWPYEILLDPNNDLKRVFNFNAVPHTIVLNEEGQVGYVHSGYVEGDEYVLEDEFIKMTSPNGVPVKEKKKKKTGAEIDGEQ